MKPFYTEVAVTYLALVLCLEIGIIFGIIYQRAKLHRDHLVFSWFNFFLAWIMAFKLLMLVAIGNRHIALLWLQLQCASACGAMATFVHFTYILTEHPLQKRLTPRTIYTLGAIMAAMAFNHYVLQLAPVGTPPDDYDFAEQGSLLPFYVISLLTGGAMSCCLLQIKARKMQVFLKRQAHLESRETVEVADPEEKADLILLLRHIVPILRASFVLVIAILIDLIYYVNSTLSSPLPFSALGMIGLSLTIAYGLVKDIVRSEKRKINLEMVAQARLKSLNHAEHQVKNRLATIRKLIENTKPMGAVQEIENMEEMLDTMLNAARVKAGARLDLGKKTAVDIEAMLRGLCQKRGMEAASAKSRWRVESALPVSKVFLHEVITREVLDNLIDNAFKYSPEDTLILLQVSVTQDNQTLIVKICDQGIGISPEAQKRIFKAFHREEEESSDRPGIGLGLDMAFSFVEAMAGTLTVESEGRNKGSVFVVTLPYHPNLSLPDSEDKPN